MGILSFIKLKQNWKKSLDGIDYADVVMFSEGNMYKNTNMPVLEELVKHTKVHYITLDKNDELLRTSIENVYPFFTTLGFFGSLFLKNIKAKLFITTTPGLGVLALKKSKNVKHYSHIMHSAPDIHRYAKFSFDCFDNVVCSGDFQVKSLNHLENVRNFPTKEKVVLGVPYYDIMVREFDKHAVQKDSNHKTILIAPSWGNSNFLNYYKKDIVGQLLDKNYNVILRPHPQSFKHEPLLIKSIVDKYKDNPLFALDKNISNIDSMKKSDVLISSYSGIIFDFIFLTEKPCIVFDVEHIGENFEDKDIDFQSWESVFIPKIGYLVSLDDDIDIEKILDEINSNQDSILKSIRQAKNEVANFGNCGNIIANYYLDKVKE